MKQFFTEIFEYHHHFNQQLANQVIENRQRIHDEDYKLFCHVLSAHQVWNSRILKTQSLKVWETIALEDCKKIDSDNYNNTLKILEDTRLEETVTYTNSRGDKFSNTVKDILFHVNNHSTYHKGQLVSKFKAAGIQPMVMDYIFYKR